MDLLKWAIDKAAKTNREKLKELTYKNLINKINEIIKKIPNVEKLPNLTRELILIEFPNYGEIVDKLHAFKKKLKYAYKQSELPSEFFGRSKKIIKKYQKYFDNAKRLISYYRRLPKLKNEFTIVLAGFPNVGKSTFLKNITGANPKIASYPFTTKGLNVGYIDYGIREFQIIDTPGILDREKLNKIEQKAYTAIKNAADLVLFLIDPSETCGYPVDRQLKLYEKIKQDFKNVLLVSTKCDLAEPDFDVDLKVSINSDFDKSKEWLYSKYKELIKK